MLNGGHFCLLQKYNVAFMFRVSLPLLGSLLSFLVQFRGFLSYKHMTLTDAENGGSSLITAYSSFIASSDASRAMLSGSPGPQLLSSCWGKAQEPSSGRVLPGRWIPRCGFVSLTSPLASWGLLWQWMGLFLMIFSVALSFFLSCIRGPGF